MKNLNIPDHFLTNGGSWWWGYGGYANPTEVFRVGYMRAFPMRAVSHDMGFRCNRT